VISLYPFPVDASLAWTVVGSVAGVAGVGVAIVATVIQSRSRRTARPEVTAELAQGQLAEDGVLCVEFESGETNVIMVPKPETKASADRKRKTKAEPNPESKPVNAIFICNHGQTPITLSRCHYVANLNGAGFIFEPQPAASPRGDQIPKRLEPGEDALIIHEFVTMPIFLNKVLRDHGVDQADFEVVLTLGHGVEVAAASSIRVHADMSEEELAAAGTRLVRQEIGINPSFARPANSERWQLFRKNHARRDSKASSLSGCRCSGSYGGSVVVQTGLSEKGLCCSVHRCAGTRAHSRGSSGLGRRILTWGLSLAGHRHVQRRADNNMNRRVILVIPPQTCKLVHSKRNSARDVIPLSLALN
jgi:hypothetical protein